MTTDPVRAAGISTRKRWAPNLSGAPKSTVLAASGHLDVPSLHFDAELFGKVLEVVAGGEVCLAEGHGDWRVGRELLKDLDKQSLDEGASTGISPTLMPIIWCLDAPSGRCLKSCGLLCGLLQALKSLGRGSQACGPVREIKWPGFTGLDLHTFFPLGGNRNSALVQGPQPRRRQQKHFIVAYGDRLFIENAFAGFAPIQCI